MLTDNRTEKLVFSVYYAVFDAVRSFFPIITTPYAVTTEQLRESVLIRRNIITNGKADTSTPFDAVCIFPSEYPMHRGTLIPVHKILNFKGAMHLINRIQAFFNLYLKVKRLFYLI